MQAPRVRNSCHCLSCQMPQTSVHRQQTLRGIDNLCCGTSNGSLSLCLRCLRSSVPASCIFCLFSLLLGISAHSYTDYTRSVLTSRSYNTMAWYVTTQDQYPILPLLTSIRSQCPLITRSSAISSSPTASFPRSPATPMPITCLPKSGANIPTWGPSTTSTCGPLHHLFSFASLPQ